MTCEDFVIKRLEPEYIGLAIIVLQRFGRCCSLELSEVLYFSHKNVPEYNKGCKEISMIYFVLQREDWSSFTAHGGSQEQKALSAALQHERRCIGEDRTVGNARQELVGCGGKGSGGEKTRDVSETVFTSGAAKSGEEKFVRQLE